MHIVDLSYEIYSGMPGYPGDPPVEMEQIKSLSQDGSNGWLLSMGLHGGTHVDVPQHMLDDARTAGEFPLERFSGNGVLLDVRGQKMIEMKDEYRQRVGTGDMVLFYTGFDEHYGTDCYFTSHPAISEELALFLLSQDVKVVGMDMPSPDREPHPIHKLLLGNEIFLLENLRSLNEYKGRGVF